VGHVLVLGGYGNFGKRIALGLARQGVAVVIAGRDDAKAEQAAALVRAAYPAAQVQALACDVPRDLALCLQKYAPAVVINTCGPFQHQDYAVAESCIRQRVHYMDLADGRAYVTGITQLDAAAKQAGICVISGASTVPGLSSAVVEHYQSAFSQIDSLRFGIAPGQKAERGLATTAAILSYVGKKLLPVAGSLKPRYGWQDLYRQPYPELGPRWMANCEVPDLDLFPQRYGIKQIQFSAGMENPLLHFAIWGLSWLVRLGLPIHLPKHAKLLWQMSHWFDHGGSDAGGMHVLLRGVNPAGKALEKRWFIIAKQGDGPQIPCVPAIVLAKKLASTAGLPPGLAPGAMPCVGLLNLQEYRDALADFAIRVIEK